MVSYDLAEFPPQVCFDYYLGIFDDLRRGAAKRLAVRGFGLALLVALVFKVDQPFKGQTSISPEPIVKVTADMQARTS
jgi:hypothetical protein